MSNTKRYMSILVAAAAVLIAIPAGATPGSGASSSILARGAADEKVKSHSNQPYEDVVQQLPIAPGGHTGWPTHPGNALAVVKSGTLTIYDGDDSSCTGRDFAAGQVYLDEGRGHVHFGRNLSATAPLEIVVTYLDVPLGGSVRQDAPNPGNCPF